MKFTKTDLTEVHGVIAEGVYGERYAVTQPSEIDSPQSYRDHVANFVVYLDGTVKLTYQNYPGAETQRTAGQTSHDSPWTYTNPGAVTFEVITPSFKYLCLRMLDSRRLSPAVLRADAGQSVVIPPNTNAVVAVGAVSVSGQTVRGVGQVLVGAAGCTAQATEDSVILLLERAA